MIVTLAQAKARTRVDSNDEDDDLALMLAGAEAAVLGYLKVESLDELAIGSPAVLPQRVTDVVTNAVLVMFAYMYKDRDNDENREYDMGYLPRPVIAMLYPLRDPSVA